MENVMTETWSKPRKAYQLWTEVYRPQGKTQKQLAHDLGVSHQLIRRYVMAGRRNDGITIVRRERCQSCGGPL